MYGGCVLLVGKRMWKGRCGSRLGELAKRLGGLGCERESVAGGERCNELLLTSIGREC